MVRRVYATNGFALVTVLWVLAATSTLAVTVGLLGRRAIAETTNEVSVARSLWAAQECAAILRDAAATALRTTARDSRDPQRAWRGLERLALPVTRQGSVSSCEARLESNGARLDLNRASEADLQRFVVAMGIATDQAHSFLDALLDWRDSDDIARPTGAESDWYLARALRPPRNGPLASEQELQFVRGFEQLLPEERTLLQSVTGVDEDPIDLWHAPPVVLRSLPGFSSSVTETLMTLRASDPGAMGMPQLLGLLTPPARDSVVNHYAELIARVETQPHRWRLIAQGRSGVPTVTTRMELLLGLGTDRITVVRRRYWTE